MRPVWWCALHDRALAALDGTWRTRGEVLSQNPEMPVGHVVLDDLVAAGLAEVERVPLARDRVACGERVRFRRAAA